MIWPFRRRVEKRESSFTDALISQIVARSSGKVLAEPNATAALEACSRLYASGLAASEVSGPEWARRAVSPAFLALLGRSLVRQGECLFYIEATRTDGLALHPVADHDVDGGYARASWVYRVNLAGPSRYVTKVAVSPEDILHFFWARDPSRPWRGQGPMDSATLTGRMLAGNEQRLGDELAAPSGHILAVPDTEPEDAGDDVDANAQLREDMANAAGRTLLLPTVAGGWETGKVNAPMSDWRSRRFGADPPATTVTLRQHAESSIYDAAGVPRALVPDTSGGGTASREALRRWTLLSLVPLLRAIGDELTQKLGGRIELTPPAMMTDDVGRASMVAKLVQSGMSIDAALEAAGLGGSDE